MNITFLNLVLWQIGLHLPFDWSIISSGSGGCVCKFSQIWVGAGGELEVYRGSQEGSSSAKAWAGLVLLLPVEVS